MENRLLQAGTMLRGGTYRVERPLSSGGFGNTYVVTNVNFDETFAMKEFFMKDINHREGNTVTVSVPDNMVTFDSQRNKFQKEAKRLRKLKNEHIVGVHDLFEENGTSYYVMDFIDGESLNERLKRTCQPLPEDEVRRILDQLLDALDTVHQQGIWHLDLKPGNIMINRQGKALLIDFGASKQMRQGEGLTSTSGLCYTPGYAPVEQMEQNLDKFGPWTDIYSLGATLYHLLTLNPLPLPMEILEEGEAALKFPPTVSQPMRKLIGRMMQASRQKRPQSIAEVRQLLGGKPVTPSETTVAPPPPTLKSEETKVPNTPPTPTPKVPVGSADGLRPTSNIQRPAPAYQQEKSSRPVWPFILVGGAFVLLLLAGGGIFLGSKLLSNNGGSEEQDSLITADVSLASLARTENEVAGNEPIAEEVVTTETPTTTNDERDVVDERDVRTTPPDKPTKATTGSSDAKRNTAGNDVQSSRTGAVREEPKPADDKIFDVVEVQPSFREGDVRAWLARNLQYPPVAAENGISGRVVVGFVVEKNGSISNVQVLRGVDPSLDREAVRVVKAMPKWNPGTQRGKPVRVKYNIPVTFKLQ